MANQLPQPPRRSNHIIPSLDGVVQLVLRARALGKESMQDGEPKITQQYAYMTS